jgi:hypothetical protein
MSVDPYVQVPLEVLACADLEPSVRLVYAALLAHARGAAECFPSEATLAAAAGVSQRSVRRAVEKLAAVGWLAVVGAPPRHRRYRIGGPRVAGPAGPAPPPPAADPADKVDKLSKPDKLPASLSKPDKLPASLSKKPDTVSDGNGHFGQRKPANLAGEVHGLNEKTERQEGNRGASSMDVPNTGNARAREAAGEKRPLWTALAAALPGGAPHPHNLLGCRMWDEGIDGLLAEGVTPAEVPALVAAYRARMPRGAPTPPNLARYAPSLRVADAVPNEALRSAGADTVRQQIALAASRIRGGAP